MRILVIEDNRDILANVLDYLQLKGYSVDCAQDGLSGLHLATTVYYDLIVLDIMLPGVDGYQVCKRLREDARSEVPILMLTARDALEDRLTGLRAGADDYLVKPFQKDELLARLNALVRRSAGFISPRVKAGDYELDLSRKELTIAGEVTVLTSFEYLILEYLMRNARQVVSKQQLLDQLYGDGEGDPNTIEVMVSRLRKKLDPEGLIQPISTIRRQGYIFNLSCS